MAAGRVRVIVVRHGRTDYNEKRRADCWPADKARLNGLGKSQAEALVAKLAGERISKIYCSPLTRCRETLAPLAAARGLEIETLHGLRELDVPALQDRAVDWDSILFRSDEPLDGVSGASVNQVIARVAEAVRPVVARHAGETIVMGSHGDPSVYVLMAFKKDIDYDRERKALCPTNGGTIVFEVDSETLEFVGLSEPH